MKVSLKSVMELAHSLKARYCLNMSDALKLAWVKAKGFAYAAEVSVIDTASMIVTRVYLPAADYATCEAVRRDFVRTIAAARTLGRDYSRNVHSSMEIRI